MPFYRGMQLVSYELLFRKDKKNISFLNLSLSLCPIVRDLFSLSVAFKVYEKKVKTDNTHTKHTLDESLKWFFKKIPCVIVDVVVVFPFFVTVCRVSFFSPHYLLFLMITDGFKKGKKCRFFFYFVSHVPPPPLYLKMSRHFFLTRNKGIKVSRRIDQLGGRRKYRSESGTCVSCQKRELAVVEFLSFLDNNFVYFFWQEIAFNCSFIFIFFPFLICRR